MTPEQVDLIERLRALLADEPVVREVSMFGGRTFMVNEKMMVSALKDGSLLVRFNADQHQKQTRKDRDIKPGLAAYKGDKTGGALPD